MKTSHTAGTWEVSKHATPEHSPQYGVHNGGTHDLAIVKGDNAAADAAFIVRACNSHDELVEALQKTLQLIIDVQAGRKGFGFEAEAAKEIMNKALAAARRV